MADTLSAAMAKRSRRSCTCRRSSRRSALGCLSMPAVACRVSPRPAGLGVTPTGTRPPGATQLWASGGAGPAKISSGLTTLEALSQMHRPAHPPRQVTAATTVSAWSQTLKVQNIVKAAHSALHWHCLGQRWPSHQQHATAAGRNQVQHTGGLRTPQPKLPSQRERITPHSILSVVAPAIRSTIHWCPAAPVPYASSLYRLQLALARCVGLAVGEDGLLRRAEPSDPTYSGQREQPLLP
jgi:hypothetical protein